VELSSLLLVYATSGLAVQDVMVGGEWLLRHGQWTTLDYGQARRELEDAHQTLRARRRGLISFVL
jgi:hypothetical protein